MNSFLMLTQNSTFIIGPVAKLLGYIMEGIFWVLENIGIPNIGIAIILFTIIVNLLMLPLTIKQQKFSKFSAKMNPEIQAIQKKYQGKNDMDSMTAMQQETRAVYAKYGVKPTGSCLQLLIQMPILFALYRVIYSIPAYVDRVKEAFFPLVTELMNQTGSKDFIQTLSGASMYAKQFKNEAFINGETEYVQNTFVDVLNRASETDWELLVEKFPDLSNTIQITLDNLEIFNKFLFVNIAYSPWDTIKLEWVSDERNFLVMLCALMIPVLSAVTQWVNLKLAPSAQNNNGNGRNASVEENPMMASMKTMNNIMPLMSAFFCFTLPAGMGIYWIAGAVIRCIQQVIINKYIDSLDMDKIIEKNVEKYKKKLEKQGVIMQGINEKAKNSTRNVNYNNYTNKNTSFASKANKSTENINVSQKSKASNNTSDTQAKNSNYSASGKNAKSGSIAAKANMVKDYNERNNK